MPGETSLLPSPPAADTVARPRSTELDQLGLTCWEEQAWSEMCQKTWLGFAYLG